MVSSFIEDPWYGFNVQEFLVLGNDVLLVCRKDKRTPVLSWLDAIVTVGCTLYISLETTCHKWHDSP